MDEESLKIHHAEDVGDPRSDSPSIFQPALGTLRPSSQAESTSGSTSDVENREVFLEAEETLDFPGPELTLEVNPALETIEERESESGSTGERSGDPEQPGPSGGGGPGETEIASEALPKESELPHPANLYEIDVYPNPPPSPDTIPTAPLLPADDEIETITVREVQVAVLRFKCVLDTWKTLLGVWPAHEETYLEDQLMTPEPGCCRRFLQGLWGVLYILLLVSGAPLQVMRCADVYEVRLGIAETAAPRNVTEQYTCVHSFTWFYLVPLAMNIFCFMVILGCWYMLIFKELAGILYQLYDAMEDVARYPVVSRQFYNLLCRDTRRAVAAALVLMVLSTGCQLVADGLLTGTFLPDVNSEEFPIALASEVVNICSGLVLDGLCFYAFATQLFLLNYLRLYLMKIELHARTRRVSMMLACPDFFFKHYFRGFRLMIRTQVPLTAAMCVAISRFGRTIGLVALDLSDSQHRRYDSLALLPITLLVAGTFFVLFLKSRRLTFVGYRHHLCHVPHRMSSRQPQFAEEQEVQEEEYDEATLASLQERLRHMRPAEGLEHAQLPNRTPQQWREILKAIPPISGRILGRDTNTAMLFYLPTAFLFSAAAQFLLGYFWPLV